MPVCLHGLTDILFWKMVTIEPYRPALSDGWDSLVDRSRNGTFLHRRAYMDYHSDRFDDCSLIACNGKGEIVAGLPANRSGDIVCSHSGLTYGGWLLSNEATAAVMLDVWEKTIEYLKGENICRLIYKPVPYIFHRYPADDDIYGLVRMGAQIGSSLVSSAVSLSDPIPFASTPRWAANKARRAGFEVRRSTDFPTFFAILTSVLQRRHNAVPVHSLAEIELLVSRFPENIRLYGVFEENSMIAGTILYITDSVVHTQYIASSPRGFETRALPLLFASLIDEYSAGGKWRYFDFGTSNEQGGAVLNTGLLEQKCSFGARAIAFNTFELSWQ